MNNNNMTEVAMEIAQAWAASPTHTLIQGSRIGDNGSRLGDCGIIEAEQAKATKGNGGTPPHILRLRQERARQMRQQYGRVLPKGNQTIAARKAAALNLIGA